MAVPVCHAFPKSVVLDMKARDSAAAPVWRRLNCFFAVAVLLQACVTRRSETS